MSTISIVVDHHNYSPNANFVRLAILTPSVAFEV